MKKCLVLGGGFAGLTSAVYLSKAGFKVELIEASPKLGGRAYSYVDPETGTEIDNGQHILMGCYKETLNFFKLIGALDKLEFQKNLSINFLRENNNQIQLSASKFPYPFNLLFALLNYKAITFSERLLMVKFFLKLPFNADKGLEKMTVAVWLEKENQNESIRKAFWDFLSIGALNTSPDKASAKVFSGILKEIFLRGNKAAIIILPGAGLSGTYCTNAQNFIEEKSGVISLSEKVEELIVENNKIVKVKTGKREISDYDFVISAIPHYALEKIIATSGHFKNPDLKYSSILSVHIWLNQNNIPKTFYGLIGSQIHWLFNHGSHLTLVISDAGRFMKFSKEEIFDITCEELNKFLMINRKEIISYKVIKEKRATFIPSIEITGNRSGTETKISNFFLAGDWIETGLPSTIESAVKSGRMAAELISNH